MRLRNWKQYRPTSLPDAIRACKDYALEKKGLSVARICVFLCTNEDTFYKWASTDRMPALVIPQFELICGCHYVSDFLSAHAGRIVIPMPKGQKATESALLAVNQACADAVSTLAKFYANPASVDTGALLAQLRQHLEQVAFHHGNVQRYHQPELEGFSHDD